jgi:hypothetical protein
MSKYIINLSSINNFTKISQFIVNKFAQKGKK